MARAMQTYTGYGTQRTRRTANGKAMKAAMRKRRVTKRAIRSAHSTPRRDR